METKQTNKLNEAQMALLRLIAQSGPDGCLVYGRPYAESAAALERRNLIAQDRDRSVCVASMGALDRRTRYMATIAGLDAAREIGGAS